MKWKEVKARSGFMCFELCVFVWIRRKKKEKKDKTCTFISAKN